MNQMYKLITIVILLTLQGCFYQTVDSHDIQKAQETCKDHKGVYEIIALWSGGELVYCSDNFSAYINKYRNGE